MPHDPFKSTEFMSPSEVLAMLMSMGESAIANVPDAATRAKVIRSYCVALHELAMGLGAEIEVADEEAIESHIKIMTEEIADIRPMYDLFKKVSNAQNN